MAARVTRISVQVHRNPLGGKIWNPAIRWTDKYAVFVQLHDDAGTVGLGECWCFDTTPDALVAFLRTEVIPHFLGVTLDAFPQIAARQIERCTLTARHGMLASALSAIDIAAWDLRAQNVRKPLWRLLSPQGSGRALTYASGGLYGEGKNTSDLCHEMADFAARGFTLSKMKVGALSIREDAARVTAVLDALPDSARLIIDGVYSYAADQALRLFDHLPAERIEAFQSPVKAIDYAGMARLARAGIPVMATEAEYRPELHAKLVHEAEVSFLQTAAIACGGLSRVQELTALVKDTPAKLSLEVSSTAVALTAAIHAAAAEAEIAHVEYHTVHTALFEALALRRTGEGSHAPPEAAGLGITLPQNSCTLMHDTSGESAPENAA